QSRLGGDQKRGAFNRDRASLFHSAQCDWSPDLSARHARNGSSKRGPAISRRTKISEPIWLRLENLGRLSAERSAGVALAACRKRRLPCRPEKWIRLDAFMGRFGRRHARRCWGTLCEDADRF